MKRNVGHNRIEISPIIIIIIIIIIFLKFHIEYIKLPTIIHLSKNFGIV